MTERPISAVIERTYGESYNGRVAHIYREDEDVALCGVELVRGVTEHTMDRLCQKCDQNAR